MIERSGFTYTPSRGHFLDLEIFGLLVAPSLHLGHYIWPSAFRLLTCVCEGGLTWHGDLMPL